VQMLRVNGQGILVRNGATARVTDCEVDGCGAWGISVGGHNTQAFINSTIITLAPRGGIDIGNRAKAAVENCTLESCKGAGVTVTSAGTEAMLRHNRIRKNGSWGIWGYNNCQVTVDANTCTANVRGAIKMEEAKLIDLTPRPRLNVPNDQPTIEQALVLIPDNGIVAVHPGTYRPRNNLQLQKTVDIEGVGDSGAVIIERAEFQISGKGNLLRLLNLTLADSVDNAVMVTDKAECIVEDCEIFSCRAAGIEVSGCETKATIQYSVIHGTSYHGVHVFNGASATVQDSEITGTSKNGAACSEPGSMLQVINSVLASNTDSGAEVHDGAHLIIRGSLIHGNGTEGVRVDGESTSAILESNEIRENEIGVWGWRGTMIKATSNNIWENTREDFDAEDGCQVNHLLSQQPLPTFAGLKRRPVRNHWQRPTTAGAKSGDWDQQEVQYGEFKRPLLATYDNKNSAKALHVRSIHKSPDQAWKHSVGEEHPHLVEGSLVAAKLTQEKIEVAQHEEEYLLQGKRVLEDVLCGPASYHVTEPWKSQFEEYGDTC